MHNFSELSALSVDDDLRPADQDNSSSDENEKKASHVKKHHQEAAAAPPPQPPPPLPPLLVKSGGDDHNRAMDREMLEMMYLARGGSLAMEEFNQPPVPDRK
jgi:hypothetical protein